MALRVLLLNDLLGPLKIDVDDPIDINSLTQTIKRSEQSDGIIFEVIFDLDFIKAGRRFIKEAYETAGGIDAVVVVNIYEYDPNLRKWKLYATGQVNYNKFDLSETMVTVNIEQTGVERRVLNMMELDVDLETEVSENGSTLPEQFVPNILFHSKAILKQYEAIPVDSDPFTQDAALTLNFPATGASITMDSVNYVQFDSTKVQKDDLTETFKLPVFIDFPYENPFTDDQVGGIGDEAKYVAFLSDPTRLSNRNPIYQADEAGTLEVDIQLRAKPTVEVTNTGGDVDVSGCGATSLARVEVFCFFEHRDKDDNILLLEEIGEWTMPGCGDDISEGAFETKNYTNTLTISVGDKAYCYLTYRVAGTYISPPLIGGSTGIVTHDYTLEVDATQTYISLDNKTVAPETFCSPILIHEAFERCIQYYTNQEDCFYSELLGRTDLGYDEDGEYSMLVILNGHRLRVNNDKKIFANLQDLLEFVNSVACVGIGFETVDGKQRVRLEKKEFFYDKTTRIASLGRIFKPKRRVDPKRFINQIEYGYSTKIDIGQVNAVDAFNTVRRSRVPIINTKNQLKVSTKMLADGFQIENQRRLFSSTKDGKHDDQNFAVVVIRDGGGFKTKKNEGYDLIENVYDPESGYNYDISPGRNLKNWYKVIASSLIRSTNKTITFSLGDMNYTMRTQKTGESVVVEENGSVDLTNVEPIWDNEIYSIEGPMTREIMQLAKANPFGYFEFEDQFGEKMEGFINTDAGVEHDSTKKKATLELLRVYRP